MDVGRHDPPPRKYPSNLRAGSRRGKRVDSPTALLLRLSRIMPLNAYSHFSGLFTNDVLLEARSYWKGAVADPLLNMRSAVVFACLAESSTCWA